MKLCYKSYARGKPRLCQAVGNSWQELVGRHPSEGSDTEVYVDIYAAWCIGRLRLVRPMMQMLGQRCRSCRIWLLRGGLMHLWSSATT